MKFISGITLAGVLALGLATGAQAQTYAPPQIPTPANPFPENPIATNGTPLPRDVFSNDVRSGRSAFVGPVGGLVDTGVGTAGALMGAGAGIAGGAVDAGVGTARGAAGTADDIIR